MNNPRLLEAWLSLTAEAMRGTREAQEAFRTLFKGAATTDEDLDEWMAKFMPGFSSSSSDPAEVFETWLAEWQEVLGVVPRSRYLALLEKYDKLQHRLEQAEHTIKTLQVMLHEKGHHQEEAKQVLDMWGTMLQDTLKMQSEWMRTWTEPQEQPPDDDAAADESGEA